MVNRARITYTLYFVPFEGIERRLNLFERRANCCFYARRGNRFPLFHKNRHPSRWHATLTLTLSRNLATHTRGPSTLPFIKHTVQRYTLCKLITAYTFAARDMRSS